MYDDTCRFLAVRKASPIGETLLLRLRQLAVGRIRHNDRTKTLRTLPRPDSHRCSHSAAIGCLVFAFGVPNILEDEIVYQILRRDIMQESTVYRSIERDARKEEKRVIALNLLRGGVDITLIASSTELSIEEVQQLQQQLNGSAQS
jgi:hypothetical protein